MDALTKRRYSESRANNRPTPFSFRPVVLSIILKGTTLISHKTDMVCLCFLSPLYCTQTYLIFVFFLHEQNFWRIKFTPKKRVNYDKIHSKLPIFCVITAKYTVNCQIFALNLKKFTPAKKNLHEYIQGVRDKYEV